MKFEAIKKVVLLGGGQLLLDLAKHCQQLKLELTVIIAPRHADEPMNSGLNLEDELRRLEIPSLIKTEKLDDPEVLKKITNVNESFCLSISAPWIFTASLINDVFKGKLVNTHSTRLPLDRGGGGPSWLIMKGTRFGNSLLHLVDPGIDTGNILAYEDFIFPMSCRKPKDYLDFHNRKTFEFISKIISELKETSKTFSPVVQQDRFSTYNPRLSTPISGWINWDWSIDEVDRFICAFDDPYPGARTTYQGKTVILKDAFAQKADGNFHPYQAGLVYRHSGKWLFIAGLGGELVVSRIEDENGKDLLSSIKVGERFITPVENLEKARQRVIFTPTGVKTVS